MGTEYFWMGGMWIFPLIGIAFMFVFIYLMFFRQNNFKQPFDNNSSESADEILKKRYANGDISKEEFEQKKKDIK